MPTRFRYSPWDGTQGGFELDALDLMEQLTDDLLYHGDLNAALRRLLQQGFEDRNGEHVEGLREMLEQLRQRREDAWSATTSAASTTTSPRSCATSSTRSAGARRPASTRRPSPATQRRQEVTDEVAAERNMQLDLLPPDLAGQVRELQEYDFTSSEARERFDELVDKLRQQLMQSYVDQMSGAMPNI